MQRAPETDECVIFIAPRPLENEDEQQQMRQRILEA